MILLWGLPDERPLARVAEELDLLGAPWQLIDQRDEHACSAEVAFDCRLRAALAIRDRTLYLDAATAVYHRCHDPRRLPQFAADPAGVPARHILAIEDVLLGWLEITSALVVNRPSSMGSNSSKPFQLRLISESGFRVPDTIVTTSPAAVDAFCAGHRAVVYKSISGVRSKVARLGEADRQRIEDITACPTQFQAFVPGVDYRVHVVADRVFATRIVSDVDDYRYPGGAPVSLTPCDIDARAARACADLCARLGLHLGGIDLRLTPAGDWYCFEVNPSPAFTYYEDATGQPIAAAIAELLATR